MKYFLISKGDPKLILFTGECGLSIWCAPRGSKFEIYLQNEPSFDLFDFIDLGPKMIGKEWYAADWSLKVLGQGKGIKRNGGMSNKLLASIDWLELLSLENIAWVFWICYKLHF